MFDNINDDVFIDGFKDLFVNKNSHSFEELFCEKYFILLNYTFMGVVNKHLAFSFLFRCTNQDRIFEVLEKKFNYSLVDFYNDTKGGTIANGDIVIYHDGYDINRGGKKTEDTGVWKEYTIPIVYNDMDVIPTHIIISCSASQYGDYFVGSTSSRLWLDDFELIY
jgi:hypothetical protein